MPQAGFTELHDPILPFVNADVVRLVDTWSVQEARDAIRARSSADDILYLYVVDGDSRLVGHVPIRQLLLADRALKVRDIMSNDVVAVPSWATVLVACEYFVNRRFLAFPVVEDGGRLIGTIDVKAFAPEVLDIAKRNFEDVFQIIGVHAREGRTPWLAYKDRFPWLLCNVGGGLLCAFLSARYESLLDVVVVLALFIPVVLALAESVSIQSVTLTLQSLHNPPRGRRVLVRGFVRELETALLLGASCGAIVGGTAWAWQGNAATAAVLAGSIGASMITAALLGLAIPTTLHAVRADPKIAAGPIVLALTDLATLLFYFNVAGAMLT
jgi:magnesium transporter